MGANGQLILEKIKKKLFFLQSSKIYLTILSEQIIETPFAYMSRTSCLFQKLKIKERFLYLFFPNQHLKKYV